MLKNMRFPVYFSVLLLKWKTASSNPSPVNYDVTLDKSVYPAQPQAFIYKVEIKIYSQMLSNFLIFHKKYTKDMYKLQVI